MCQKGWRIEKTCKKSVNKNQIKRTRSTEEKHGILQTYLFRIPRNSTEFYANFAQMGTFAETANVDYCLSFADQGKQTSVFYLQKTNRSLPFAANKWKFPFSLSSVFQIYIYIYIYINIYISIYLYIYMYIATDIFLYIPAAISNGKWKDRQFS